MSSKLTLFELNKNIQEKLNSGFPESLWVVGEISEIKINRNGHCYLELIEKDAITDNIIARSRATIWAFTFRMLKPYFEQTTNRELGAGIKILINVSIEFHELYGLSLNISDIDPSYTLGDIAQKKAETIAKLVEEGVINMNKDLAFPLVPQKIAIISSETAAGYQDFINQLENNSFGYKFYTKLFPSLMQGVQAEESIIHALEKIYMYEDFFDIVIIIRGGGSQADLGCFDNYLLATNIAQFPIPILTGIGHDKDQSISDIVAHKMLKTPTAVAEYIIEQVSLFENEILHNKDKIVDLVEDHIHRQTLILTQIATIFDKSVNNKIDKYNYYLKLLSEKISHEMKLQFHKKYNYLNAKSDNINRSSLKAINDRSDILKSLTKQIKHNSIHLIQKQELKISNLDSKSILLDPENILKRGYSLTYSKGNIIKDINEVNPNDEIQTKLYSGIIRSKVSNIKKTKIS